MQFEKICRENYARIYNYILAKTGEKETAEDITQDVFLIALQKGDAFLDHEKPIAFLYTAAKNLVLEYYKKERNASDKEAEFDESRIVPIQKDIFEELCLQKSDSINETIYLEQVLNKLKPKEKDLYRKYYIDKKPMKALAKEFHISEPAIRMKYMRIHRKVQKIVAGLKLDDF